MLQACLNGKRGRDFHPAVPRTPQELAVDARRVVEAGARELHVHPRDWSGRESLAPSDIGEALQAVRAAVPGIPVGVSTGWWIAPGGVARQTDMRGWRVLPDYVSVTLSEDDAPDIIAIAFDMRIGVEAGLASARDAERLEAHACAPRCLRALIEINEQDIAAGLRTAHEVIAALQRSGLRLPQLLHGFDATKWPLFREALRLKLDARIGLEDGRDLPSSETAKDNADLIRCAIALASDHNLSG